MSAKPEELFKNKIRLIYEYNSKTPLFSRIAGWEIENNSYANAIEILEKGLREFPDFPTPYFLLGKAYCMLGEFSKALKCYKKGGELIHSKETYHFYLKELESLKNLKTPPGWRTIKFPEKKKEEEPKKEVSSKLEDNLDDLAEKISKAKIPLIRPESSGEKEGKSATQFVPVDESDSAMIVSETLAKIYVAQGEVQEAIAVYEKLSRKDPARKEYFLQKISELKLKP